MTVSKNQLLQITLISTMLAGACNNQPAQVQADAPVAYTQGTFGYDLDFLKQHDSVIVLRSDEGKAKVIVSAKYQGKVFTSTAEGNSGQSFGWIHYKAFSAAVDSHMNAYGGENRLWLGPEGGKFSLFFSQTPEASAPKANHKRFSGRGLVSAKAPFRKAIDAKMSFQNWRTPAAFDIEPWKITRQDSGSVSMEKDMKLVNYAGTPLSLTIGRNVAILDRQAINSLLNLTGDTAVKAVGYQTVNTLTNTGVQEWTEKTGMPCIWMLDMFNPSPATVIVVPYKDKGAGKVATTDYFGEIPADRIKYDQGVLLFRADGKSRGKLGLNPTRAKNIAGSYDALHKVLTLTLFDVDSAGKYLNQEWNTVKPSFSGDAVNAYNDGALADGSQMGPFYEIESVSPAAFLQPGKALIHKHAVFHFTGDEAALDRISTQLLGVSLSVIKKAF